MPAALHFSSYALKSTRTTAFCVNYVQKARIHDVKLVHLHHLLHSIKEHPLQLHGLKLDEIKPMQAGFENFSIAATDLLRKIEATSAGVMVMPSKVAGHVVKGCWLCGGGELKTNEVVTDGISIASVTRPNPRPNSICTINHFETSTIVPKEQLTALNMGAHSEDLDL